MTVETGAAARVTGLLFVPLHFHRDPDAVLIAINAHIENLLGFAAGRALVPQFAPGAGPVMGFSGLKGLVQSLPVHPGEHEHLTHIIRRNTGD